MLVMEWIVGWSLGLSSYQTCDIMSFIELHSFAKTMSSRKV